MLLKIKKYFATTLHVIALKCSSYTNEVREKVLIISKSHIFLRYCICHRDVIYLRFCLFEDVTDYHELRRIKFTGFF